MSEVCTTSLPQQKYWAYNSTLVSIDCQAVPQDCLEYPEDSGDKSGSEMLGEQQTKRQESEQHPDYKVDRVDLTSRHLLVLSSRGPQ